MPRLTEHEQQEIIRFIEAGKPLLDKYRLLPTSVLPVRANLLSR